MIDNLPVRIHVIKIEKRIVLKASCYLELLTPETMKLLASAKNKTTKDKNGENVPHLEITELLLVVSSI